MERHPVPSRAWPGFAGDGNETTLRNKTAKSKRKGSFEHAVQNSCCPWRHAAHDPCQRLICHSFESKTAQEWRQWATTRRNRKAL
eukprot:3440922-Rhodomonas_salina.2